MSSAKSNLKLKNLILNNMMGGSHNVWGMGYGWIISSIILVVIIWVIVKALMKNNKPD